jgi:hypothetical protein
MKLYNITPHTYNVLKLKWHKRAVSARRKTREAPIVCCILTVHHESAILYSYYLYHLSYSCNKREAQSIFLMYSEIQGADYEVKEAKMGYLVSYLLNKKTIANYVSRKKGLIIRLYANCINQYMGFLDILPDGMVKTIRDAPICKRLMNHDTCNSKCPMGYDFVLRGQRLQKCRSNAFMFLLCAESNPFIKTFLKNELEACAQVK